MKARLRFVRLLGGLASLAAAAVPTVAAAATPADPPVYRWQNVVIKGGGFVSGLVFHATERDLLYAGTDVGAFRWDTWILRCAQNDKSCEWHGVEAGSRPNRFHLN